LEANNEFFAVFEGGFTRANKEGCEWGAAGSSETRNFRLRVEGREGDGPIRGGEGVGDVASERGGVADLRTRDQVAGFDQSPGVRGRQRVPRDAIDWDGGADEEEVPPQFERGHLRDGGYVNQSVDGRVSSLFQVEEQVGAAREDGDGFGRVGKRVQCFG
jgi:hypothetical protein